MTATLLAPAAQLRAAGEVTARVPGTLRRLKVLAAVRHLPAADRCPQCAGTGIEFTGGQLAECWCSTDLGDGRDESARIVEMGV